MISTDQAIASAVQVLPQAQVIRVTPDQLSRKVAPAAESLIPRIGVFDWQPAGDGTFKPVIRVHETWMRLTDLSRLVGMDCAALRRLATGGFIESRLISPRNLQVDVHSYFAHVEACRDPEFWTPKRIAAYSAAL